jgi:LuxR family maltose regulon positive regulatory protein
LETAVANRESLPFVAFQDSVLLLVSVFQAMGRAGEADALLADLLGFAESVNDIEALERARAYTALVAMRRGHLPIGFRWLDHTPLEPPHPTPMFSLPTHVIQARLLVARGTPKDLERASMVTSLVEQQYQRTVIPERSKLQIGVLRGLIAERSGNHLLATGFMRDAMDLVRPNGFVRTLTEFGPSLLPLLRRLPPSETRDQMIQVLQGEPTWPAQETAEPVATATTETVQLPAAGIHPQDMLTRRELQVLELLRRRLSNREISDELFISPLTVKRHNSNIFDKLGVSGRREAVRRAEELGLLNSGQSWTTDPSWRGPHSSQEPSEIRS